MQRRVASQTIVRVILELPNARSRKVIGTSVILIPARVTAQTPSTWNP
jgi:hypothetical protein